MRSFDARAGTGEIEAEDGRRLAFHCTSIADGTRTIPVDVTVEFVPSPGHHGSWEAAEISRVPAC